MRDVFMLLALRISGGFVLVEDGAISGTAARTLDLGRATCPIFGCCAVTTVIANRVQQITAPFKDITDRWQLLFRAGVLVSVSNGWLGQGQMFLHTDLCRMCRMKLRQGGGSVDGIWFARSQ